MLPNGHQNTTMYRLQVLQDGNPPKKPFTFTISFLASAMGFLTFTCGKLVPFNQDHLVPQELDAFSEAVVMAEKAGGGAGSHAAVKLLNS